jgi:23S rRNA (cytidine2498-2'-O)-methyltransferase
LTFIEPQRDSQPRCVVSTSPDFTELALAELRSASPKARVIAIAPGVHLVTGISFRELTDTWRSSPPIFVRHVAPIDFTIPMTSTHADLATLAEKATETLGPRMAGGGPFSVQSRIVGAALPYKSFDLNVAISERVATVTGISIEVRRPSQIISLLMHDGKAHMGLSTPTDNLSRWSGGQHRLAREDEQLSRAEFKLLEALDSFDLKLPTAGRVLDLGAAPGGWTRISSKQGQRVVAVDPARLHPSLDSDPSIEHHAVTAERYVGSATGPFDAILNDIRQEPHESAALMQRCAALLNHDGFALVTLKLRHAKRLPALESTLRALEQSYGWQRARQLFHNRSEVTIALRKPQHRELSRP